MIFANIRRIVGAGVLGLGALAMAVPAEATVTKTTSWFVSRNSVGDTWSGILGNFNTTVCALNHVRSNDSTTQNASCELGNFGGTWQGRARVFHAGASVECGVTCYQ